MPQHEPIIHNVKQISDAWFKLKAGVPSSSSFGKVITGLGTPSKSLDKYALLLATEKFLGHQINDGFKGSQAMDRGVELEDLARKEYQMIEQVEVRSTGFITDYLMRYGCSSDGFIGDDGVLEIKNLISTTFFESLLYFKKHGKTEPKYVPQVMGELFITKRKWCDLFIYNPDFPTPIIERFYPDKEYFKVLEAQLKLCIAERNRILKQAKS